VLQAAATAHSEVRAFWLNPVRRRLAHFSNASLVMLPVYRNVFKTHHFTRQGTLNKDGLAIPVRHTTAIMGERFHRYALTRFRQALLATAFAHEAYKEIL
jgi:hypothetical protein